LKERLFYRRFDDAQVRMKTKVSPMWLTYFMVRWDDVKQFECDQKCTDCGSPMKLTEPFTDGRGVNYEGYVCHRDKRVTWLRVPSRREPSSP
jgi:hypothetical protein